MIPPAYRPSPRYGLVTALLVLAVVAVIVAVTGIGTVGREHHATDGNTEVHVVPSPTDTGFHEQDISVP
ncbi:hypothetical protein H9Y04_07520 [Streptomyces sp. TRM66268-LWL]|uniref:Secreted protein n=1 Tax=Streptomyces polyasparticus TaxID=2767826 RepID=A0ABR7SC10_9ACTN|nr:hypothetical protein [Streptomyces polyasparticus]MBC9712419.1 hypothetical protein [Streptomyces polyasparticus]